MKAYRASCDSSVERFHAEATPGSTDVAVMAGRIIGFDRVDPRGWALPVTLLDLTQDEFEFFVELFGLYNVSLRRLP